MGHRVIGAAAQVNVGGRIHTVLRGDLIPEGVGESVLEGLVAKGLIEVVPEAPSEEEAAAKAAAEEQAQKDAADKAAAESKEKADKEAAAKAAATK